MFSFSKKVQGRIKKSGVNSARWVSVVAVWHIFSFFVGVRACGHWCQVLRLGCPHGERDLSTPEAKTAKTNSKISALGASRCCLAHVLPLAGSTSVSSQGYGSNTHSERVVAQRPQEVQGRSGCACDTESVSVRVV